MNYLDIQKVRNFCEPNLTSKIEKVLSEFGLKIYAIGAEPDADGMYIETEEIGNATMS